MKKKKKNLAKRASRLELRASVDEEIEEESPWQYFKPKKIAVSMRLDADVLKWFRNEGGGYQTRINRALRRFMLEEKRKEERGSGPASRHATRSSKRP